MSSTIHDHDIIISGGGVAGLIAAAAFGGAGFRVLCVDPAPPVTGRDADGADLRTTAFLQPARDVLTRAGVWDRLAGHATPLRVMRIVDAGGTDGAARARCDFVADEVSPLPFGWNLPNWLLRRELVAHLAALDTVTFRPGVGTTTVLTRQAEVRVGFSDGSRARARLLIGADGRNSPVRDALGIGQRTRRFGQKALAFAVTHAQPHDGISTEIHRAGGPFTLVPLPDLGGRPCSAVIWMERGPEALRLAALDEAAFNRTMTDRSCGIMGDLRLAGARSLWPIVSQIADRFSAERCALIAEAAHVVPPIGAQGLNMSIADIALLLDLARGSPADPGRRDLLDRYHLRRHTAVLARVSGIEALNRASMAGTPLLQDARLLGLTAIHGLAPVRRGLMRLGTGSGMAPPARTPARTPG